VVGLQVVDEIGERAALTGDGLLTAGVGAQDGRDAYVDGPQVWLLKLSRRLS
jgi:hypothetical protein